MMHCGLPTAVQKSRLLTQNPLGSAQKNQVQTKNLKPQHGPNPETLMPQPSSGKAKDSLNRSTLTACEGKGGGFCKVNLGGLVGFDGF